MDARCAENEEASMPLLVQENNLTNGRITPQLFMSVPTLNEAASYIADTTSYLTSCLPQFSERAVLGRSFANEQELVTFSSAQREDSGAVNDMVCSETTQLPIEAPHRDGCRRTSADLSSGSTGALVESAPSTTIPYGITLFQGLIDKARRTVRGSADDIGWLQRDPSQPPAEDGTERFMEILNLIRHGVHRLPKSAVYLLIPGLFSNHGPLYFTSTKASFSKMGLACHIAKIHSEAAVEKNAQELRDCIEELYWGSNKRVMLLGHSKGGIDAAAALSMYWPDLKDKVVGLVLAQSPYGGSPIASDILREGQLGDYVNFRKLTEILICKVLKGDMAALEDLTYEKRKEFLKKFSLPRELPVVSFHTEAKISPAVLATLSRVAHAELGESAKLPVVMPLGAAMAACAQLLQLRYGERSDGLVTCRDAEVPGSIVVRPKRKLDHAWMVYSSLNDDPSEADASQVCEALLTLLMEVEERKKLEFAKKDK